MLWYLVSALLVGKIIISVAAAFPTQWWNRCLGGINRLWRARTTRRLEQEMARQSAGTDFSAQISFLPQGIGLALDTVHHLLFLAEQNGGSIAAAVIPYAMLDSIKRGEANSSGFYDYYVELRTQDLAKPSWRLLCGDNRGLADDVEEALAGLA